MKRLNWGCGPRGEPGWLNADVKHHETIEYSCDIRSGLPIESGTLDYVVSIHALQMLSLPDVVPALVELRRVLCSGGVIRLGLPDLDRGIQAYQARDTSYFYVSDSDAQTASGKFITHMLWFGYSVTLFTGEFACELLTRAGFDNAAVCHFGTTRSNFAEITSLDNRPDETVFVEGVAP